MNKSILFLIFIFSSLFAHCQNDKNTLYVEFNPSYEKMRKVEFVTSKRNDSSDPVRKSFLYFVKVKDPVAGYPDEIEFKHVHFDEKGYELVGGQPPKIETRSKLFLDSIHSFDIDYFRNTPEKKVIEKFTKKDVKIYLIDYDEYTSDSITLREVKFSPPLKQ